MEAGPIASRHVTWSRSSTVGHALRVPAVYDFDSDEDDDMYDEEVSEAVLPMCASFESLTREEANRYLLSLRLNIIMRLFGSFIICINTHSV